MILLFGMPRSGTSWVGKIFDSHPDVLYRHEPDKNVVVPAVPLLLSPDNALQRSEGLSIFLDKVLSNRSPGVTAKLPMFPKNYRHPIREWLRAGLCLAAKSLPASIGKRTQVPDLISRSHPAPTVVWKSINSVGRLGALARALPAARGVLILRHPCGQIASLVRGHEISKLPGPLPSEDYGLLEILIETAQAQAAGLTLLKLRKMHSVERMAWMWVLFLDKAICDIEGMANCHVLRYEDLCDSPLAVARTLFELTKLSWHSQTEKFIAESTAKDRDRYFGVQKDPRRSAQKWRTEIANDDARRILDIVSRSKAWRMYVGVSASSS